MSPELSTIPQRVYDVWVSHIKEYRGTIHPTWDELAPTVQKAWQLATVEAIYGASDADFVILPLWTPVFDVMGVRHTMKHMLLATDKDKAALEAFANRYGPLSQSAEGVTTEQELAMYADMGKLLALFLPTLTKDELALLGRGDRYRLLIRCFDASQRMREEVQQRNALDESEQPTPEMEVGAAVAAATAERNADVDKPEPDM